MAENQQEVQEQEKEFEFEIEDDTPPEDRGRQPMPKEIVEELEKDELEEYSDKVKTRLLQMKKVWHDERREKEAALREQREAVALAQKIMQENQSLKSKLNEGEKSLVMTATSAAELEMNMAERAYKEAYEAGDSEKLMEAQKKLLTTTNRLERLKGYVPRPQEEPQQVQPQPVAPPPLEPKTAQWRAKNTWFGTDPEMTALALGLHQKLESDKGVQFTGTDEYWSIVDNTMKRRFPEYFETPEEPKSSERTEIKPATVVAPATRSTAPKKVKLSPSQMSLIKKLGITPQQYATEFLKSGAQNG
jgi:hypothetical protein